MDWGRLRHGLGTASPWIKRKIKIKRKKGWLEVIFG